VIPPFVHLLPGGDSLRPGDRDIRRRQPRPADPRQSSQHARSGTLPPSTPCSMCSNSRSVRTRRHEGAHPRLLGHHDRGQPIREHDVANQDSFVTLAVLIEVDQHVRSGPARGGEASLLERSPACFLANGGSRNRVPPSFAR